MDQRTRLNYMLSTETHFKCEDTYKIKIKGWRSVYHTNTNQKKAGVATWIWDKAEFRARTVIRNEEGYCIIIKGSALQKDRTSLNVYTGNNRVSKCVRQKVIELQRNLQAHCVGWRLQHPSACNGQIHQKIRKDAVDLKSTADQLDLQTSKEYSIQQQQDTILLKPMWNVHWDGHLLDHKLHLSKFTEKQPHQTHPLITMELNWKSVTEMLLENSYLEMKQHTSKWARGKRKSLKRNLRNISNWVKMNIQFTKIKGMNWKRRKIYNQ